MRRVITETRPDCLIHLGDCVRDAEAIAREFPELPMHMVCGNCDPEFSPVPEDELFELDGVRIFIAHGHRHRVKYGLDAFRNAVYFSGASLGLFGHTHSAFAEQYGSMQILNPGSIGDLLHPSCAVVEIRGGAAFCRLLSCER